jgi:hypothetical protein
MQMEVRSSREKPHQSRRLHIWQGRFAETFSKPPDGRNVDSFSVM